ncbi:hypothetical protein ACP275_08G063800 [Erythranthe tilingii]
MVLGWRRAFCTSIPKDQETDSPIIREKQPDPAPNLRSRFTGFFSDPPTPRLNQSQPAPSQTLRCRTTATPPCAAAAPASTNKSAGSPKLKCKTTRNNPRLFFHRSAPSSPRSPSTFSLLKSTLRLSKSRCGICLQGVKAGEGTAILTAECGHSFHFPCLSGQMKKQVSLTCPVCSVTWKEMHLLKNNNHTKGDNHGHHVVVDKRLLALKVYNDDEPISSPISSAGFNTIPEEGGEDFPGFFVAKNLVPAAEMETESSCVEVALFPEAAVVSVGKTSETYAVVLKLKASAAPPPRRAPVDLVAVLDVGRSVAAADKLQLMRRVMRMVVSSLSAADRLSIVAFSTTSKRLLPLRRMTAAGKRSARRIIDAVVALDCGAASATDAVKKAAKVIEDRREKNPAASILVLSDGHHNGRRITSARFAHSEIPVHSVNLNACLNAPPDDTLINSIIGLLSDVTQDFKIQLGFTSGSAAAEISAVYTYTGKTGFVGSGSSWCRVGSFHSGEERELLIELKVPLSLRGAHRLLSFRSSYKDPSTQQTICDKERALSIPRPRAVGSSTRDTQRLRCLFITTRAVAESRRMAERNDVAGAHHMLASARALIVQSGSGSSGEEFVRGLEAEMAELNLKRRNNHEREAAAAAPISRADDKAEPLTPTSAWRAAERLAKVAMMRKSLNRVSDLHGFENARF